MLTRRDAAVAGIGLGLAVAADAAMAAGGGSQLAALHGRLARLAYRRDFKTAPLILKGKTEWDDAAIREVAAYAGGPKQVWDNKDLGSGWAGFMRNAMNGQMISFGNGDFLTVSMTRGDAQLALFDQTMWDKYQFAKLTGGKPAENSFITAQTPPGEQMPFAGSADTFSPQDSSIPILMRRGAVFMACHNAIWAAAGRAMANVNPDKLSQEQVAAELTNHLLAGVILTPGALGTLPVLQQAGFHYVT